MVVKMSPNEIICLKHYFESKSLHVSDYWLQCCLEWFKGEYNTYSEDIMCTSVYQQWLDSDLRDIEVRSLPINLTQQKNTVINGKYAVQVMYVKDISKPAYSQLKNMRDMYKLTRSHIEKDNENESNETTGKRVLYLYMTDGVQNIQGFEYHSILCLNLYMKPGIKILLTGPLIVRNGEFMFKENNVKILGGEVEDLQIKNAAENVLARELNMPENPNPKTNESNIIQSQNSQRNNTSSAVPVINNQQKVNVMMQFEDEQLLANFDTSAFEVQEAAIQTFNQNQDADLDADDDVFEALDISAHQNVPKQNLTNSAFVEELAIENLEQIERQEFERRLEDEDFNFHLDDDFDITEIIENKSKQKLITPVIITPQPFIYIKYLQDNIHSISSEKVFRVKAFFDNVIEKVKVSKNKGWTMKFEIKDASGTIIVDFLSDVIEELMGLSPFEAIAENRSVKHNVAKSHEKVTKALAKCREKMKSLEYIMHLKFNEDKTCVTIIKLEPVNKQHVKELKNRVENIPVKIL